MPCQDCSPTPVSYTHLALALSVSDRLVMLENSIYSILSPEGFASILWKDQEGKRCV